MSVELHNIVELKQMLNGKHINCESVCLYNVSEKGQLYAVWSHVALGCVALSTLGLFFVLIDVYFPTPAVINLQYSDLIWKFSPVDYPCKILILKNFDIFVLVISTSW